MTRVVMTSIVRADGSLHLTVPIDLAESGSEVRVTVEAVAPRPPLSPSEWSTWVDAMAGSWRGDFERPPQEVCEEREPLS
jgi:hypothetical protein